MITFILFTTFLVLVFLGTPIALCLGISSLITLEYLPGTPPVTLLVKSAVTSADSFPLVAIPLFVLAGEIMSQGGLSARIVRSAYVLVGKYKAGLAYVNVLASMFFAAISGSSPATVAAIGANMIPEMEKAGYKRSFSAALTAASGITGVMIPPSIPFIIYGVAANQSIGKLFLAGVIPGLIFGIGFMLVARFVIKDNMLPKSKIQKLNEEGSALAAKGSGIRDNAIWTLIVPLIILGGIYLGVFTPTEAAGVAVVYGLVVSLYVYRNLRWADMWEILRKSALTSVVCIIMVVMASSFGRLLTLQRVPVDLANFIISISNNAVLVLLLINIMLLIAGMFMETIALIIILTPILLPIATQVGIDPIHFGVIMTVNLAIGFCTPPLGANLFIATSIADVKLEDLIKKIIPFLFSMIISLMLVTYIPALSLWLPSLMD